MAPALSAYTKQRIVNLAEKYPKYMVIVRILFEQEKIKVSRQTVSNIVKKYTETGITSAKSKSGRKSKWTLEHYDFLDAKMRENDENTSYGK